MVDVSPVSNGVTYTKKPFVSFIPAPIIGTTDRATIGWRLSLLR